MAVDLIGWDIGGAHLKAAALDAGHLAGVAQQPCPLWLGLEHFHAAARAILAEMPPAPGCRHAVTMTGELADLFAHREAGVFGLLHALAEHVPSADIRVFAGATGFIDANAVRPGHVAAIASANWLATGLYAARQTPQALLLDIGSTTTDLLVLRDGAAQALGHTDSARLRHGELVYSGAVRTSLMAIADAAPLDGEWVGLMAEHFATTADVYRLTGELPAHADQSATADGAAKTPEASARRLARLAGRDLESADMAVWRRLAYYFRERQLARLTDACQRQLSRNLLGQDAPVIGAGVGRFLAHELARRLAHPYLDFDDLFPTPARPHGFHIADCAPAVALAYLLAERRHA
ncbi:MAG: hydantoinase/oxoprolinase family protein [Candidatus Methylumidiphilus sp.]